jgi:anti-sigma B factor antagonist
MKRVRSVHNRISNQALVEGGKLSTMCPGERQQIAVRHLRGIQNPAAVYPPWIKERNVIGPKIVAGQSAQRCQEFCNRGRCARGIRIAGVPDDSQDTVFRERAGSPGFPPRDRKPLVGPVVLNMSWVDQRDEDIDIEQEPFQRSSSRNWRTSSDVTLLVPGRTGKRGTPFRVWRRDSSGFNPSLAREEITSPTVLSCAAAISFAALSTSSSMERVVRITTPLASNIIHQMPTKSVDVMNFMRLSSMKAARGGRCLVPRIGNSGRDMRESVSGLNPGIPTRQSLMSDKATAIPLTLDVVRAGDAFVVHCNGKLVAGVNDILYVKVSKLIPATKRIVLDLTNLTRVDSTGLGTLVRLKVSARSAGCSVELINLGKQVRLLLGTTGLMKVFATIGESGIKLC